MYGMEYIVFACPLQGCTIYKQDDAVFIGRLLKGCDAEASGESCNAVAGGVV